MMYLLLQQCLQKLCAVFLLCHPVKMYHSHNCSIIQLFMNITLFPFPFLFLFPSLVTYSSKASPSIVCSSLTSCPLTAVGCSDCSSRHPTTSSGSRRSNTVIAVWLTATDSDTDCSGGYFYSMLNLGVDF